jgi:hypothetical protein
LSKVEERLVRLGIDPYFVLVRALDGEHALVEHLRLIRKLQPGESLPDETKAVNSSTGLPDLARQTGMPGVDSDLLMRIIRDCPEAFFSPRIQGFLARNQGFAAHPREFFFGSKNGDFRWVIATSKVPKVKYTKRMEGLRQMKGENPFQSDEAVEELFQDNKKRKLPVIDTKEWDDLPIGKPLPRSKAERKAAVFEGQPIADECLNRLRQIGNALGSPNRKYAMRHIAESAALRLLKREKIKIQEGGCSAEEALRELGKRSKRSPESVRKDLQRVFPEPRPGRPSRRRELRKKGK